MALPWGICTMLPPTTSSQMGRMAPGSHHSAPASPLPTHLPNDIAVLCAVGSRGGRCLASCHRCCCRAGGGRQDLGPGLGPPAAPAQLVPLGAQVLRLVLGGVLGGGAVQRGDLRWVLIVGDYASGAEWRYAEI